MGQHEGSWSQERIEELMVAVGIDPKFGERRPTSSPVVSASASVSLVRSPSIRRC